MNPKISEYWEELSDFIISRNSLDQGALSSLRELLIDQTMLDPVFADQVTTFLTAVTSQPKPHPQGSTELLALLSVDALISNLYLWSRNGQSFQPRSSSFYGWMSSSQMSMDYSNVSERQGQIICEWIGELASSQLFFKRLQVLIEKRNQERVKKYAQCLLETIDTVLGREKISRQTFLKFRGKYVGLESRRKWEVDYVRANSVIFSSQLNKIVAVLTEGADDVHSALLRIYRNCSQDSPMFEGARFTGDEMLTNLYRYYVNSFKEIEELFEEGKHPLFRFLRNHLALFFTPSLRKFHQLVVRVSTKCGNDPGYTFYKNGSSILQTELRQYINDLPGQLFKLLSLLKELIEEQHPGLSQFALSSVKKLFFYSFLANQGLIEELNPRHDPGKWAVAYNHILALFFQGSIKKYGNLGQSQQNFIGQMIQTIAGNMDARIVNQYIRLEDETFPFRITDTILNHDYQIVLGVLSSLEFTPKDSKQFDMKKIANIAPQSPVYKHLKGQSFNAEQSQEELELATWMSVGGSRDWGLPPSKKGRRGVAERLKGFQTISVKMRAELEEESASWGAYLKG